MALSPLPRPQRTMLYDEDCGICTASAAWVGRRLPASRLRLLGLSAAAADPAVAPFVVGRDLRATLHVLLPPGEVLTGARAVLSIGRLVPRWRLLAIPFDNRIGQALLEPVYRLIARHRRRIGRLLGLPASCPMPSAADRPR